MFDEYPDVLTVKELGQVLGIGRNKAYSLLKDNSIDYVKIGKQYRIPKYALIRFVSNTNCIG